MIIKSIAVKNFRAILEESLDCADLTVLVGRNGAGKSSFLRALEMFYESAAAASVDDFYAEDVSKEIEIAVTFDRLEAAEKELFAPYLDAERLTISRVFSLAAGKKSGTYHGSRLQNPDFFPIRMAGGKKEVVAKYKEVREQPAYQALPVARAADEAEQALKAWEAANADACTRQRDDGQFFGFTGVGQGYLGRHTRFIRIPAVRDASTDAMEGRGSCVTEIMDLVVRSALARKAEFTALKDDAQRKYREIMDPGRLTELSSLQTKLSETLAYYAPEAAVSLDWAKLADLEFPLPKAEIKLNEDGYKSAVRRTGHGLQRAFILTMLQHLVAAKGGDGTAQSEAGPAAGAPAEPDQRLPSLVLAIEEPELYQHPSRQRHLASILLRLASGTIPGVAKKTQVMYTTHSPLFVGLDRFEQIRLLRKADNTAGKPRITKVTKAALDVVAEEIWIAGGQQGPRFTAETLKPRLQAVMTPWVNEGFFADVAVLVEGEDDRAAILGVALSLGHNFDSDGIAVIPCSGKNNLDRPFVIFRRLGVPAYLVWDGDHGEGGARPDDNRRLLKLIGQAEEDWPATVAGSHACFKSKLEDTLADEIGRELFDRLLTEAQTTFGIPRKNHATKNPMVIQQVIQKAGAQGKESHTMKSIVGRIVALKPNRVAVN